MSRSPLPVSAPVTSSQLAARMETISPFRVVEVMEQAWQLENIGRSVVHLVAGEPDFGTPARVVEAVTAAIADGHVHYTSSLGIPPLREAISHYYQWRFGIDVPASRIVVTTGASGALMLAFAATLNPGDRVVMTDPGYPCNSNLLRVWGAAPAPVPVGPEDNYQLDVNAVEPAWTDKTRAVLVGTPSNPTGTTIGPGDLADLVTWTQHQGGLAFVDEVYGELLYDRRPSTVLAHTADAFVINSFSKTFGMTGWRLGWLVCPEWALDAITRLAQNLYISPPGPAQSGGVAAFSPPVWEIVEERRRLFQQRRDLVVAGLGDIGFGVPVLPEGAFYVYARSDAFSDDSSELVSRLLHQAGVALAPGDDFGDHQANHHVRVSYATSLDHLELALERLGHFLGRS